MEWFKGPEGKVHQKESEENDAWILDMYDAYLEQMGDEAANLPYSIKDKKAKRNSFAIIHRSANGVGTWASPLAEFLF